MHRIYQKRLVEDARTRGASRPFLDVVVAALEECREVDRSEDEDAGGNLVRSGCADSRLVLEQPLDDTAAKEE